MKQLQIAIEKAKPKKSLGILLLFLGIWATADAQFEVHFAKGFVESLPSLQFGNLRIQDHCTSVIFSVTNTGGSSAGAFKVNVVNNSTGRVEKTFYVSGLNVFEAVAFSFQKTRARDDWGIVIDPDRRVFELTHKDNGRSVFCPE